MIRTKTDIQNRYKFASVMAQIDDRTPRAKVIELLGPPDDVRTASASDPGLLFETVEMWCYGTDRHLGFPTLGHLYFNGRGVVHHHHNPPMPSSELEQLFNEDELQALLQLIDRSPSPWEGTYHPRLLIQIVNRLQSLGKAKVVSAVSEYLRVAPHYGLGQARTGIFLVLRLLFDPPVGHFGYPEMEIGQPIPPPPADRVLLPRFPLALHSDIPLVLVRGYILRGVPEPVERHVAFYAANASLRGRPLVPTSRPFTIFEELLCSPLSMWLQEDVQSPGRIAEQLLQVVDSIYRPTLPPSLPDLAIPDLRQWLIRCDQECQRLGLHWDSKLNDYALQPPASSS